MEPGLTVKKVSSVTEFDQFKHYMLQAGLPVSDLNYASQHLFIYYKGDAPVATSGFENLGNGIGLLRSVSITPKMRGQGLGNTIVSETLRRIQKSGNSRVFLLTETAVGFFGRLGFAPTNRAGLPPEVIGSSEFKSVCPASATVMEYALKDALPE